MKRDDRVKFVDSNIHGRLDTDPFPAIGGMLANVVWANAEPRYQCVNVDNLEVLQD